MSGVSRAARINGDEVAFAAMACAAVQQAPMFVGLCDAHFRFRYLNEAGRQMVGLAADADIGAYAIADFFTPNHRRIVETISVPAMLRDGRWTGELCLTHFTDLSRQTQVRWSAFTLRDESGAFIGAAAFTTDQTARPQAERALGDRHGPLAALLDDLPVDVGIDEGEGSLMASNPRPRDYTRPTPSLWRASTHGSRERGYDADPQPVLCAGALQKAGLAAQARFLDATISSIPDLVYAFDQRRRFAYANAATLALFGRSAADLLGKNFDDLEYPVELAQRLYGHIDRVLSDGVTVEDEVFYRSPTGQAAYFAFLWGPVYSDDGSVEGVVGVSRDTSERRAFEEELGKSEARLRAASDLVGLGIYAWDPSTGALDWDERLRAMWGLPPDAHVDMEVYEAGIVPDDLPRVRSAIAACVDPAGDGGYDIEYRVRGRDDGIIRHIATSGRTTFAQGRAVGFIGAAIEVTTQRRAEAAIQTSEAQFRSFAAYSRNLIWIGDPAAGAILYRSAAYERIWGTPCPTAPTALAEWIKNVHPDDRLQVEHALATVEAGEVAQFEYRIIRPADGRVRWLRDTSFPIPDEKGVVTRIGGISEELTQEDVRQVYVVSATAPDARRLAAFIRALGYRARIFESALAFLDMAAVLAPGCVLVDLRKARSEGLLIPRELKARSMTLPTLALDAPDSGVEAAVAAMKAGAVDYVVDGDEPSLRDALANAMVERQGAIRPTPQDDNAGARIDRLTQREREVLVGLIEGGTNKSIAQKLGISPRTVELHRAQVMNRLNASNLTELLRTALAAGVAPSTNPARTQRKAW